MKHFFTYNKKKISLFFLILHISSLTKIWWVTISQSPPKKFTPTFNDLSPPENENLPIPPFNSYFEKCSTPPYDQGGVHTMQLFKLFQAFFSWLGNVSHSTSRTFGFRGTLISPFTRDSFWPTVFLTSWYPLDFLTQFFGCYLHGRFPFLRPAPAYRVVVLDFLKLYLIIVCLRPSFSWPRWVSLVLDQGPSSLGHSLPFT